jgi:hypothetical protein
MNSCRSSHHSPAYVDAMYACRYTWRLDSHTCMCACARTQGQPFQDLSPSPPHTYTRIKKAVDHTQKHAAYSGGSSGTFLGFLAANFSAQHASTSSALFHPILCIHVRDTKSPVTLLKPESSARPIFPLTSCFLSNSLAVSHDDLATLEVFSTILCSSLSALAFSQAP